MSSRKKLLWCIITFVFSFVLFFSIWSFVLMDANPSNWTEQIRFSYALTSLVIGAVISFGIYLND